MSSTERDFAATVPGPDEQQDAIALLCDVQKTYRLDAVPVHVIKGVDLLVRPGHFTVLLGPSGSGKTTLLNMIGASIGPTVGPCRSQAARSISYRTMPFPIFGPGILASSFRTSIFCLC
jgi:ABC-type branched-subunit amino acid transport system ATPase component